VEKKVDSIQDLPAGDFSAWLGQIRHAQDSSIIETTVSCGECNACCRSSLFIHIKPDEKETLGRIPKRLLFPAPGLPPGHVLMGYDENGKCPMLQNNGCSIYDSRPQTCRQFDCRIFSATGVEMSATAQASIVEQARRWRFAYPSEVDRAESSALLHPSNFCGSTRTCFRPDLYPATDRNLRSWP
jgi:uncharacterized protein